MEMIFDEMLQNSDRIGGLDTQCYTVLIDGYSHAISNNLGRQTAFLLYPLSSFHLIFWILLYYFVIILVDSWKY